MRIHGLILINCLEKWLNHNDYYYCHHCLFRKQHDNQSDAQGDATLYWNHQLTDRSQKEK